MMREVVVVVRDGGRDEMRRVYFVELERINTTVSLR